MITSSYDVLIIGGGPAGSAAAYTLAYAGISVCVVDKATFPRDKLCGGLLTLRSKRLFEHIFQTSWDDTILGNTRSAEFYYLDKLLNKVTDYKDIAFTSRLLFDAKLINLAEAAGATIMTGKAATRIRSEQNVVVLADNTEIRYRYLIGCDGVCSLVAKTLFKHSFDKEKISFALEMEIPQSLTAYNKTTPEIVFGYVKWGYSWIFPRKDEFIAGLAGLYNKNTDFITSFRQFLTSRFGFVPDIKIKGHYLPFGRVRKQPGKANILLCGDAVGLVDPITGEGIAYAMESGYLAAKAILKSQEDNSPHLAYRYYERDYRKLRKVIAMANILKNLIYPRIAFKLFIRKLPQTGSIPRMYFDLLSGDTSYRYFTGVILRKIVRGILKSVFTKVRK